MYACHPLRASRRIVPSAGWLVAAVLSLAVVQSLQAQGPQTEDSRPMGANFQLAARFAPYRMSDLVFSTTVSPRWIQGSERFWYEWETSDGKFFYIVDPVAGTRRQLFDRDRIAAELTRITRDPWDAQHLPIRAIRFLDANTLHFEVESSQDEEQEEVEEQEEQEQEERRRPARRPPPKKKVFHFEYDVRTQTLRELDDYEEPDNHPSWASVSPDGQAVVFARNDNLYMMSAAAYDTILDARRGKTGAEADSLAELVTVEEIQLTTDGEAFYSYAVGDRGMTDNERAKKAGHRKGASVTWSRDSRRFALVRSDQRHSGDLWVIHSVGNDRPELETYRYGMPGEDSVTQQEILIYDLPARSTVRVQADAFQDQTLDIQDARQFRYPDANEPRRSLWLAENSDQLYFTRGSRDLKRVDVCVVDAGTGEVRVLIEERLNTYIDVQRLELLRSGDLLWWSERDGWGHLYRFAPDGTLRSRLTEGPWSVRGIEGIDEARGVVYFEANAREDDEDPYYRHLYRVGLDGAGLTLLTPGAFDHSASMGESSRFFVDNYSRVDTTPAAALFGSDGRRILDLAEADFSALLAAGYRFPEPFTVKADDRVTDLYGVMYKPFDFDSTRQYPIIAYVYPGPQGESVAKSFSTSAAEVALAQMGFIVITVGNRGGHPWRSKWYHNYGYGNLRDYGLADKKATIEQLADRHAFIDIERVGIYGHSGGGFMSTAAMLVYPDFFDVAVSSSGNHENNVYNRWWSERHHGVKEVTDDSGHVSFEYAIERNSELAANLQGHLLLTTGDIDNNVHPAGTLRMAQALIRANKRFDFFIFPGQRHGYGNMGDYWFWLRAEYFAKHLLGDERTAVDIVELNLEREKTGGGGGGGR